MKPRLLGLCAAAVLAVLAAGCSSVSNSTVTRVGGTTYYTGEFKNTSGGELLQHNFLIEFTDAAGNVVAETKTTGCLRSLHPNAFDVFEAQTSASAGAVGARARLAIDSVISAGPLRRGELRLSEIVVDHSGTHVTISGRVTNDGDETLTNPRVCSAVYDTGGKMIRLGRSDVGDLSGGESAKFTTTLTLANDSVFIGRVDLYADALLEKSPIKPIASLGH